MALILSIETATNACSVALHKEGKLLASKENYVSKSHSNLLAIFIRDILKENNYNILDLDAVAVSKGPGSYTGLRIGVSTAKGICYALSIPLLAINTLQAMANQVSIKIKEPVLLCPMIDARRMEVYCLLQKGNEVISKTEAKVVNEQSFEQWLQEEKMIFFGNGAQKCQQVIQHPNAIFLEGIEASAKSFGGIAEEKFCEQIFEDVAYFEPYYLKEFRVAKPKD